MQGTWYGANSAFLNFIFQIEKNAAGAAGFPRRRLLRCDLLTYCLEYTAWHGELVEI